jgi:hypothetical protein
MASTTNRSKATTLSFTEQLIEGAKKHQGSTTQVPLLGSTYTTADLTGKLEQIGALQDAVDAARAATKGKQAEQKAAMPPLRALRSALVAYVKAAYGGQPAILADFGIHLKTRTAPTAQTKVAAAAKRKATREARGTKGPKQTKAVKGDVVGVSVTPIVAPHPVATTNAASGANAGTSTAAPATATSPAPAAAASPVAAPSAAPPRAGT